MSGEIIAGQLAVEPGALFTGKCTMGPVVKKISEDPSLLSQIISQQRQYSDKSVYQNIDQQINKIINEEH